MKTTYICEVCTKSFTDYKECGDHEKICQEQHATGVRIAGHLRSLLTQAQTAGVPIVCGSTDNPAKLEDMAYSPANKRISLFFDN